MEAPIEPSDEQLLQAWFHGDAAAFTCFYSRHKGRVVGWLVLRGLSAPQAEDVAQNSFVKLHANISHFDTHRQALPWFFTIVKSCWIDFLRSEERVTRRAERWGEAALQGAFEPELNTESQTAQREKIEKAIGNLSTDQKELINARIFNEYSYSDLARQSGHSETALRKKFERAVKRIKAHLFAEIKDDE